MPKDLYASSRLLPQYRVITLGWLIFDEGASLDKIKAMKDNNQLSQPSILVFEIQEYAFGSLQDLVLSYPKDQKDCYLQGQKVRIHYYSNREGHQD